MSSPKIPSSTQSTTQVEVPDWVAAQVRQNIAKSNELAGQSYQAPDIPTIAPFNPDQLSAFAGVRANAGSTAPAFASATARLTDFPATVNSLLDPNLAAAETDTTTNLLRQGALNKQQITAAATSAGALGGTRLGVARGLVDSDTERAIASGVGGMSSADYASASREAFDQIMQTGTLASADQIARLRALAAETQAGGQQQTLTQGGYADALSLWQEQQNWPYEQLAIEQSALAGSPYGNTVTARQPYNSNGLASAFGTAASALPILNTLGSWAGLWGGAGGGAVGAGLDALGSLGVAGTTGGAGVGALEAMGAFTPLAGGTAAAAGGKGGAEVAASAAPLLLAA
jgi:hypothetical protein